MRRLEPLPHSSQVAAAGSGSAAGTCSQSAPVPRSDLRKFTRRSLAHRAATGCGPRYIGDRTRVPGNRSRTPRRTDFIVGHPARTLQPILPRRQQDARPVDDDDERELAGLRSRPTRRGWTTDLLSAIRPWPGMLPSPCDHARLRSRGSAVRRRPRPSIEAALAADRREPSHSGGLRQAMPHRRPSEPRLGPRPGRPHR